MGKKRLQELLGLLSSTSTSLQDSLDELDPKLTESFKHLTLDQKIEVHRWLSEHLNSKLQTKRPSAKIK